MRNKLRKNANYFLTESLKITYIENCTNSKTAYYIASYIYPKHPKRYIIAKQIF
jgi:hypothetical protein